MIDSVCHLIFLTDFNLLLFYQIEDFAGKNVWNMTVCYFAAANILAKSHWKQFERGCLSAAFLVILCSFFCPIGLNGDSN